MSRPRSRFRRLILPRRTAVVLIAPALAVSMAACGGSDTAGPSGGKQRTVVIAVPADVTSLDPGLASGSKNSLTLVREFYSSLTQFDRTGKLVGDLATSWSQDGPNAWTFELRPGARFQDGEALDARTIAWNFERAKKDAKLTAAQRIVSAVTGVQVLSPTEITFTTGKQTYLNLPGLVSGWLFLPQKWAATHDPDTEVNASGPYRLTSFKPNGSVGLTANATYYGTRPALQNVRYRVFSDQSSLISGLLGGSIDVVPGLDPSQLEQIKATGKYTVGGVPGLRIHYLSINASKKPWNDVRVREAATIAIDRATITKTVLKGYTVPANRQLFSPTYNGYQKDLTPWPYDPQKARRLLKDAGAVGTKLQISLAAYQYAGSQRTSEVIADELNAVGFDAKVEVLPIAQWSDKKATDATAAALTYNGEASPSNSSAEVLTHYESSVIFPTSNLRGPQDKTLDDDIVRAWTASTPDEQATYVKAATDRINDTFRAIDLWQQPQTFAAAKDLAYTPRADDLDLAYEIGWAE
ncbi:ABC transporter substrate-binding protein [Actinacidiphila sp. ITFR-21]|uniref:ABC transporter substrate-binding protein n=1 Tax=Actinacidiphila sp. ITFR-21 TaxID=3075199 RepID=UPI00288B9D6F|nr:ABC transporter substrate-binding protein [Streptomyces sp. ITFR-21]WNI14238.1 ABC transporter substrate-binding protein [Streptomyces sp. ITFR-21]